MKKAIILLSLSLMLLTFLVSCTTSCPELNCEEPDTIIKYQCQDGTVEEELENCDNIEVNKHNNDVIEDVNYKFTEYEDYAEYIKDDLEKEIGLELNQGFAYGGREGIENLRKDGKIYFIIFEHGEWDSTDYWAVEVDAETGELIKYKDITAPDGSTNRFNEVWWTPEK